MSALDQEVLEKYRLLDKAAQERVRQQMEQILQSSVQRQEEPVNTEVLVTEQKVTQPTPDSKCQ